MTLAQLHSFVLVARLGSVKAAAAQLELTEPAVAVAALRKELGDELFVGDGRGIALTAGGRRPALLPSEILGLAEQARRSVHDSPGRPGHVQVPSTNSVAEHIGPLIDAFTSTTSDSRSRSTKYPVPRSRTCSNPPPGHRARPACPRRIAPRPIASVPFAVTLLVSAGARALVEGIMDIGRAFRIRQLATR